MTVLFWPEVSYDCVILARSAMEVPEVEIRILTFLCSILY